MPFKQKLGVLSIFLLGFLVVISSSTSAPRRPCYIKLTHPVIRAIYSSKNEQLITCTVSMIETAIATIASCLPVLRTLFFGSRSRSGISGSRSRSRTYELSFGQSHSHLHKGVTSVSAERPQSQWEWQWQRGYRVYRMRVRMSWWKTVVRMGMGGLRRGWGLQLRRSMKWVVIVNHYPVMATGQLAAGKIHSGRFRSSRVRSFRSVPPSTMPSAPGSVCRRGWLRIGGHFPVCR